MGQASRTTKLLLDLSDRGEGGANTSKRAYLRRNGQDPGRGPCLLSRLLSGSPRQADRAREVFLREASRGTRTAHILQRIVDLG